ncbi:hypothetical protein BDV11DRAFT_180425 [Aspergillus similis]
MNCPANGFSNLILMEPEILSAFKANTSASGLLDAIRGENRALIPDFMFTAAYKRSCLTVTPSVHCPNHSLRMLWSLFNYGIARGARRKPDSDGPL